MSDIYRDIAAALLAVPETQVSPVLRECYKPLGLAALYGAYDVTGTFTGRYPSIHRHMITTDTLEHIVVTIPQLGTAYRNPMQAPDAWPDCPACKQSATGKQLGRHVCTRCGWPDGRRNRITAF